MQRIIIISFILVLSILGLKGQEYSINTIPEELKKNATAVIRELSSKISQSDANSYTYSEHKVITILNSQGKYHASFYASTDRFFDLSKFSGLVRDASGKVIKKIKKSDLTYSSLEFDSFTSGSYDIYYQHISPTYPFTIEFEYEMKRKNGVASYPSYAPVRGAEVAVEKVDFTLEIPNNLKVRHHANYDCPIKENSLNGKTVISITEKNIPAISNEVWQPNNNIFPTVLFAPSNFCLDGQCGNMDNWKNYGSWVAQLLVGRDNIPSDFATQLQNMVSNAKSEREKVKIIYEYLQKNTRYVSIQLGIGGFQPETATNVLKTKFGDCKGLTNLMKAMLKSIGIESHYCEIYIGSNKYRQLLKDFSSISQTDHAILLVPLENDSIWLECTSSTLPFGFVHDKISGNDAMVVADDGGKICRVFSHPEDNYRSVVNLEVNIKEDGNASGKIEIKETMDIAIATSRLREQNREKQAEYIISEMQIPKTELGEIDINYAPGDKPITTLRTNFNAMDFANKTGNRLFVRGYPLNKGNFKIFSSNERKHDIEIPKRYVLVDTITYTLPEDYTIESLPKDITLDTQFGVFNRNLKQEGNKIISYQEIRIKSGIYKKETYEELKSFFSQIDTALSSRLVFKKK